MTEPTTTNAPDVERLDAEIAKLDQTPQWEWTPDTSDRKVRLMTERDAAEQRRQEQYRARVTALGASTTPASSQTPTTDDLDRQHDTLDREWEKNYKKLNSAGLSLDPTETARLVDRQLEIEREQTALKAQRGDVVREQAVAKATPSVESLALSAPPLPEGMSWDPELGQHLLGAMLAEGGTPADFYDMRIVLATLANEPSAPAADHEALLDHLHARWGEQWYQEKLTCAYVAAKWFAERYPEHAADLARRGFDRQPVWWEELARLGGQLLNPQTPGGYQRRLQLAQVES